MKFSLRLEKRKIFSFLGESCMIMIEDMVILEAIDVGGLLLGRIPWNLSE